MSDHEPNLAQHTMPQRFQVILAVWMAAFACSLQTGIFLAQVFEVAGVVLLLTALWKHQVPRVNLSAPLTWIGMTMLWLVVAAGLSPAPWEGLIFLANKFAMPLAALLATFLLGRTPGILRWLAPALLIAGVFGALNGIVQYFFGVDPIYGQTIEPMPDNVVPFYLPVGLLNMALTFSGMQMMFLLFLLPWAWEQRGRRTLWIWAGIVIILLSIALSFRRGPWMGTAAMTAVFLLTRGKRIAVPSLVAGVVLAASLFAFSDGFRARVADAFEMSTHSEQDRMQLWSAAWRMGADHPLTGIGPGRWHDEVPEYADMSLDYASIAHPHSDPLWLLAVSGFPGLLLGIGACVNLGVCGVRLFRRRKETLTLLAARGGWLAWGGLVLAGLSQCYLLDGENMIALGMLLGLTMVDSVPKEGGNNG